MKRITIYFLQVCWFFLFLVNSIKVNANSGQNAEQPGKMPIILTLTSDEKKDPHIALIISGDGGWYKFEQSIADKLAAIGIPVIGVDTKKYFWSRRTPEETALDMAELIRYYCNEWGKDKLILIGYSLGAEVLPFVISRLPEELKNRISINVLLSPTATTDFDIHISDMLGMGNKKNTYLVVDEILKIPTVPSLCIFGSEENTKMPARLKNTSVRVLTIPGDHHYEFNTTLIVQTIKNNGAF